MGYGAGQGSSLAPAALGAVILLCFAVSAIVIARAALGFFAGLPL